MKIAIIGIGNVGQALGQSFVRAGHEVAYAARDIASTQETARRIGAQAARSPVEAVSGADAVVLAVPYSAMAGVAEGIRDAAVGKLVFDPSNPFKPDFSGLVTEGGPSAGENVASLLPGARVVKAFNTMFAADQANPDAHGTPVDALFATDDPDARETAAELLGSMGFRPVYVGPLARARDLEAISWQNMQRDLAARSSSG